MIETSKDEFFNDDFENYDPSSYDPHQYDDDYNYKELNTGIRCLDFGFQIDNDTEHKLKIK